MAPIGRINYCHCQQLPNHLQNLHFYYYYYYFTCTQTVIPLLQSVKLLNSTKHRALSRIGRKSSTNQLRSHDVIRLFLSFTGSQSLVLCSRGKQFWDGQNSRHFFGRLTFKLQNCQLQSNQVKRSCR